MKLAKPENIAQNEKEFIDTINAELDWEAIEKLLFKQHQFTLQEEIDYQDGSLVIHNDDIAYKFNFEIKVPLSIILNREGKCLKLSTTRDDFEEEIDRYEDDNIDVVYDKNNTSIHPNAINQDENLISDSKTEQLGSNIANMIVQINQEKEE